MLRHQNASQFLIRMTIALMATAILVTDVSAQQADESSSEKVGEPTSKAPATSESTEEASPKADTTSPETQAADAATTPDEPPKVKLPPPPPKTGPKVPVAFSFYLNLRSESIEKIEYL